MVMAQSGILLSKLSRLLLERELAGFEFASGIPGTLGGAIYMNAGAYGGEMKDLLMEVTAMDEMCIRDRSNIIPSSFKLASSFSKRNMAISSSPFGKYPSPFRVMT